MIVCIFGHVQWRWALNDRLTHRYRLHGQSRRSRAAAGIWHAQVWSDIGLYPIVTLEYSSITLYQVSYHTQ
jgi:hypothetical protein